MPKDQPRYWFDNQENVTEFADHLIEDDGMGAKELLYYFEKPWKWTDEYHEWRAEELDKPVELEDSETV